MLSDKMAISHSNHLFVPVAFVFCLLLPLIHASDSRSDNYSDSRLEKNPAVSRHRNNIQRLPNYNWKPPDKYYGPREESTEKNLGMEFTKPEDPEQRMADSWIKKMQEISRQEREKWAAHRRNMKLTLDNVEETTKAGKLTNDESITVDPITLKSLVWYPSTNQDNRRMEDGSSRSSSKQLADTNVDGAFDKKLKNDERNTDIKIHIKNSFESHLQLIDDTRTMKYPT
ncbi:uncharacterized protein LOC114255461 [Monomorium pharaonis]|uniref:uncharacterized protein LOC114255461 n=1 Tax=Monomorium pharaonis TaxID=307658 RepID=UPI0017467CE9|nr:uncharacterized protein LOC114255461 [Monomorium pharaonis]